MDLCCSIISESACTRSWFACFHPQHPHFAVFECCICCVAAGVCYICLRHDWWLQRQHQRQRSVWRNAQPRDRCQLWVPVQVCVMRRSEGNVRKDTRLLESVCWTDVKQDCWNFTSSPQEALCVSVDIVGTHGHFGVSQKEMNPCSASSIETHVSNY